MLNKDKIKEMAELAMLDLSEKEVKLNLINIEKMLKSVENIKEVDIENLKPLYNVNNTKNPLRDDVIKESLDIEDVVKNTVEEEYGHFKILRVMD